MPLVWILVIVLIAVALGLTVGSVLTWFVDALIGVAIAFVLLVVAGGVVAWRNRDEQDGAPPRVP